jgi:hypothetical protein
MIESRRCTATKKNGQPCGSLARPGGEFCHFHSEGADPVAIGRKGGLASGAMRSVRERFREDAEHHYELLFESLKGAIEAETVRWGDCPNCKHRVPVAFPDIRARTQAVQVLLDQGYGRPAQPVEVDRRVQAAEAAADLTPSQRQAYMRIVRSSEAEDVLSLAEEETNPERRERMLRWVHLARDLAEFEAATDLEFLDEAREHARVGFRSGRSETPKRPEPRPR